MDIGLIKIEIEGFKSIAQSSDLKPESINVLIGPNGAGKSNFIAFFRMLSHMFASDGQFQAYVAENGGASALLHDGPGVTRDLTACLSVETAQGINDYSFRLAYAAGDTLIFTDERFRFSRRNINGFNKWIETGAGHRESMLLSSDFDQNRTAKAIRGLLKQIVVYQFHNTSFTSRLRQKWAVDDRRWLKEDAGNLGTFLFNLNEDKPAYYRRIVKTIRTVLPFFEDFVLVPQHQYILLSWKERGSDMIFNASQASDGMLRFIALVALLGQPQEDLPAVLLLDEPELGLHPHALDVIAGLIKSAAQNSQVFVATQSSRFVDCFSPEDIVVINRRGRSSEMARLNTEDLSEWLSEYAISEAWEKNVIGGTP